LVLYPQSYPNRFGYFTSRWKRVAGNLFDKTIARLFLKMADHVIALTDAEANVYRQMGLKVTRIYEGISLDDAPPEQKVDDFRTKLNIQRDEPVLLAIGRLEERKGIDVLISAMPAILANFPTARLVIVGKGKNQTNYENLATNLKCRDRVMFLHSLSDEELACLYEMARVVVVPSYFEAYGRIPVEGWAHRKPVVVSTGVGISEAVTPDRGILVNYGDKVGLAEAILKLLRDRSLAQSMGANGYQFVMGELGWRQQAARMEEVCGAGPQP
ncbi:MAG: glycosyltransferase family 4 protein, partial [Chloroflexi bacterium]|nr:glycosyltransferase family 4 protein [Chloroflexota bacterium]